MNLEALIGSADLRTGVAAASSISPPTGAPPPPTSAAPYSPGTSHTALPRRRPSPPPATPGSFSLKRLLGAHTHSPPRRWVSDAFATEDNVEVPVEEANFMDVVTARIIAVEDVGRLFDLFVTCNPPAALSILTHVWDSYFSDLNPMSPVLDPELHLPDYCRRHSALLFSAVLTVGTLASLITTSPSQTDSILLQRARFAYPSSTP